MRARPWPQFQSLLRNMFRTGEVERQLGDELEALVEMATAEKIAEGVNPTEARRRALAEFGGIEQVKQAVRDRRIGTGLESSWRDVRFGWRQILRSPGFSASVIVTLALAIGANTAIFSIVNALIFTELPYPHPERVGTIFLKVEGADRGVDQRKAVDGEQWELLRDNVPSLVSAVASGLTTGVNLRAGENVQYVRSARVSARYFDVLGIHPLLGRTFSSDEDRPQGPRSLILSYGLWQTVFHAEPSLVGQVIDLKGDSFTVAGILPKDATTPSNADIYTALKPTRTGEGGGTNYEVIVRLRDGADWARADAEINRAWKNRALRFAKQYPAGTRVSFYTVPLQKGQTAELRPQVLALQLAAGFILLIACANLAGLSVVQMSRRRPEIATRLALGASLWKVQRQVWIENLMLAGIGGAAGIGVGFVALRALLALLPEDYLPVASVPLDGRVLGFTFVVSVLTSILTGMLPALAARKINLRGSMIARSVAGSERLRLRQTLIIGEVALTVVLLAASGLLIRTLIHLETLPPGFNAKGVMTATASLDDARYHDLAAFRNLLSQSTAAMKSIPGVENAGVGLSLPYERFLNDQITFRDGPNSGESTGTDLDYVTPGYFEALEMQLVSGRFFSDADGANAQPVAIVNRSFARKFYGGASAVGHTLNKGMVIVGEVSDIQLESGLNPVAPIQSEETVYIPAAQIDNAEMLPVLHMWFQPSWIVRTAAPVEGMAAQMQRALATADPGLPFSGFHSMNELMRKTVAVQRVEVALLATMAGLALLLSTVGIFALVANMVAQRTHEIGIRMALGATRMQVMATIARPSIRSAAMGLGLGLLLCVGALRALRGAVYGVGVYDAPSIGCVVVVLAVVTSIATVIPTLRIAQTDPATTLREE